MNTVTPSNMVKTIYKYPLSLSNPTTVSLPINSTIVHADHQHGVPTIWAIVDTEEATKVPRKFVVYGTGHLIPDNAKYVGTYMDGPFVWHIMEIPHGN